MKRTEFGTILTGFMILEDWTDDYSDWSGYITGPSDPTGANLAWERPIEMIEKRAYDKAIETLKLIAGPSEWNCALGEAAQRAAAQKCLEELRQATQCASQAGASG